MLPLDDPRWQTYHGGYRVPYDASRPLQQLFQGAPTAPIWEEFWQELHHQGDVDAASYAAVPHLLEYTRASAVLDWNVFALISTIELARPNNPEPPPELRDAYTQALRDIPSIIGAHPQLQWDALLTQSIVACLALVRGQRGLAQVYADFGLEDAKEWWEERFGEDLADAT
jgi:hypothetical protein